MQNKIRIAIYKYHSSIYVGKEYKELLTDILKNMKTLKHYTLYFNNNKFVIRYPLNSVQKAHISKKLNVKLKPKPEKLIIHGIKGCPISGFDFKWL